MLLTEHHPGEGLGLELGEALPLQPGEVANLLERESGVIEDLGLDPLPGRGDLFAGDPEAGRAPVVEPLRVPPDGVGAPSLDVGEDRGDGGPDLFGDVRCRRERPLKYRAIA